MENICTPAGSEMLSYLSALCSQNQIVAIGEEISIDGLAQWESEESIPMYVAKKLNLPHCSCDPSVTDRRNLNMELNNFFIPEAELNGRTGEEIDLLIQVEYAKRERFWLEKLQAFNKWPLLFICGANHTASFATLLKSHGIEVEIASNDWEPANSNEINRNV